MKRAHLAAFVLSLSLAGGVLAATPSVAEAQKFFVSFGGGAGVRLENWPTQLRLEQDFGFHVRSEPEGFFISFAPSQSFLNDTYMFTFSPRFGFDIAVVRKRKFRFLLTPSITVPGLGVGGNTCDRCDAYAFFHMSYNFDIKFLFGPRAVWGFYIRPVGFEVGIADNRFGPNDVFVRYDTMFGLVFNP